MDPADLCHRRRFQAPLRFYHRRLHLQKHRDGRAVRLFTKVCRIDEYIDEHPASTSGTPLPRSPCPERSFDQHFNNIPNAHWTPVVRSETAHRCASGPAADHRPHPTAAPRPLPAHDTHIPVHCNIKELLDDRAMPITCWRSRRRRCTHSRRNVRRHSLIQHLGDNERPHDCLVISARETNIGLGLTSTLQATFECFATRHSTAPL